MKKIPEISCGSSLALANIPIMTYEEFAAELKRRLAGGARLVAYFAGGADQSRRLHLYILMTGCVGSLAVFSTEAAEVLPSLVPECPQVHLFEREIGEQYGIVFQGHPWFKPVRFQAPLPGRPDTWGIPRDRPRIGDMDYYQVQGDEIHEVAVGPVHAGIIEPGHFRFQCYGEKVLHLEISLGYQHRGIEELLAGGPGHETPARIETVAGDTTLGHITAYSTVVEALCCCAAPTRATAIRTAALELERLANHVGDIGALAGDIGFLPTASYCGRLRGDYLNMTAAICGSRLGRGLVRPGGVLFDLEPQRARELLKKMTEVAAQTRGALDLFFETPSVLARLEGTGTITTRDAIDLGLTGMAARACGIDCDCRRHMVAPGGQAVQEIVETSGDVYARARVRQREIEYSLEYLKTNLDALPVGPLTTPLEGLQPGAMAFGMTEGWRGAITHVAITDDTGHFSRYKIVDPSFFNWSGLAMALRNEQISDFPLCNKSFNLSYCGFDL
ncbi:MAG: NADH-quinone oxidoreductase subunit C [Proteobacteria bacterium]|nr:NADH-quinone oxidoreductase subunit C [Pseudomonadota bacterium]MBU1710907.1 NADH-quinone oxidoreductase subunit C [Pseudomonadota bacterium]